MNHGIINHPLSHFLYWIIAELGKCNYHCATNAQYLHSNNYICWVLHIVLLSLSPCWDHSLSLVFTSTLYNRRRIILMVNRSEWREPYIFRWVLLTLERYINVVFHFISFQWFSTQKVSWRTVYYYKYNVHFYYTCPSPNHSYSC